MEDSGEKKHLELCSDLEAALTKCCEWGENLVLSPFCRLTVQHQVVGRGCALSVRPPGKSPPFLPLTP